VLTALLREERFEMPTYEYSCLQCGDRLEVVQSFRDDPLTECPSCDGSLRKVFSAVGIVFKGSGFYKTDNRSGSKAKSSSSTSSDTAKPESSSSGSSSSTSSSSSSPAVPAAAAS
jgi:putative FmdB family regulatory protein